MRPIVESLLWEDTYKPRMAYFIQAHGELKTAQAKFAFTCRTKIRLTDYINKEELAEQLKHLTTLRFQESEIDFLRHSGLVPDRSFFGEALRRARIPEIKVEENKETGQLRIECAGHWGLEATWSETAILRVFSYLLDQAFQKEMGLTEAQACAQGNELLTAIIAAIKKRPHIRIVPFFMRRCPNSAWEDQVMERLITEVPEQIIGISNMYLARRYERKPTGTMAHEVPMALAALGDAYPDQLRSSPIKTAQMWRETLPSAAILLADTFGSVNFYRDLPLDEAPHWAGHRCDSMDPVNFGNLVIAYLRKAKVNPMDLPVGLLPSDGLDLATVLRVDDELRGQIPIVYGWGGGLGSNRGIRVVSSVVKLVEINGRPTVKLSDNPAKAIGPEYKQVYYKEVMGYIPGVTQECTR